MLLLSLPNAKWPFFVLKIALFSKKVCYQVYLCENFQRQVVRHYVTVHKWLVGDVIFYLKLWAKVTHPFKNGDFD